MTAIIMFLKKYILYAIGFLFVLSLSFIKGCNYGKTRVKIPVIVSETIIKHDTIPHYIYNIWPWYFDGKDSIVYKDVPAKVDTFAILKDYYALHFSNKKWQDSLLEVNLDMMISENKFYPQEFSYKILRAQTIINNVQDNSIHYVSYLYLGGSIPINKFDYSSIDLTLSLPKWYIGSGYIPGQNTFIAKGGIKLFQFKK